MGGTVDGAVPIQALVGVLLFCVLVQDTSSHIVILHPHVSMGTIKFTESSIVMG